MSNGELITMAELAKRHDVARSTVSRWKANGDLVMRDGKVVVPDTERHLKGRGIGKYRTIDAPAVDSETGTDARDGVPVDADDPGTWTRQEARRQKEIELARKHSLERRRREGELVERADVQREAAERSRRIREALLAWPGRVASEIAADLDLDAGAVGTTLEIYVRRFLENHADGL